MLTTFKSAYIQYSVVTISKNLHSKRKLTSHARPDGTDRIRRPNSGLPAHLASEVGRRHGQVVAACVADPGAGVVGALVHPYYVAVGVFHDWNGIGHALVNCKSRFVDRVVGNK